MRKLWLVTDVAGARVWFKYNLKFIVIFSYSLMGLSLYSSMGECDPLT